jgi:hypothetical protein
MKKLSFLFIVVISLIAMSCEESVLKDVSFDWQKIDLQLSQDLKKILSLNDEVIVFGQTACWASKDLKNWEKRLTPDRDLISNYSRGPFPIFFRGKLYINGKDGLYYSSNAGKSWILGFKTQVEVVAADENFLYIFQTNGSYRSSDGLTFQPLIALDSIISPVLRKPNIYLNFGKAERGKIVLSGFWADMEYEFISNDAGLTWQSSKMFLVNDINSGAKVLSNHTGSYFVATGPIEINKPGGTFWSVEKLDNDYYYAGESEGVGVVVKNNFETIFTFPEKIRELEVIDGKLFAVGDKGALYVKQ